MTTREQVLRPPGSPDRGITGRVGELGWWWRRWPTVVAVASAVLVGGDGDVGGLVTALPLLPMIYVVLAAVGRRWLSWPVLVVSLGGFVALREWGVVAPSTMVVGVAAAGLAVGLARHRAPGGRREVLVQGIGAVAFVGLAVLAALTAPQVSLWLVAAAWFGHGVWDFVHLHRDAVVTRSYAEWCGVLDVLTAAQVVLFVVSSAP